MAKNNYFANIVIGLLLFFSYVISYTSLSTAKHNNTNIKNASGIEQLPPIVLSIIAGEFKGLLADYLVIDAGSRVGTKIIRNREGNFIEEKRNIDWQMIKRTLIASQYLDPSFEQTYVVAQGWLPWEAGMVNEMQNILLIAQKNRPWDWKPIHFRGFNTYYFFNHPGEAGIIFLEAAQIPNAPTFLSILGSRLAQKGGETSTAILLIKSMLMHKNPQDPDFQALSDRLKALQSVALIEQAVHSFSQDSGRNPHSLKELIDSGKLTKIPENPYNLPFCINEKGAVFFDNPNCRHIPPRQQ